MNKEAIGRLAQEAAQGNHVAFAQLYQHTKQRAYFVAVSIAKNETDAQDIVQESYLKAFQGIGKLEQPERFESWLNTITANQAKNYISRKQPSAFADYGDESPAAWQEETNPDFLPDERLDLEETKHLIGTVVEELPEDQRLCVLLRYYSDLDVTAIAAALTLPEGTVKSRLNRARAKLLQKLEQARRQGLELRGVTPAPLLGYVLGQLAMDTAEASNRLPPLAFLSTATAGAAAVKSAASNANAAAAASANTVGALPKVLAIVAVIGIGVGGTAAGIALAKRNRVPEPETAPTAAGGIQAGATEGIHLTDPLLLPGTAAVTPSENQTSAGETNTPASSGARTSAAMPSVNTAAPATAGSPATAPSAANVPGTSLTATTRRPHYSYTSAQTTKAGSQTAATQTTVPTVATSQTAADVTQDETTPTANDFVLSTDGYITRYIGSAKQVVVPAELNGMRVLGLRDAFALNQTAEEITLSTGIESIRNAAFGGCGKLRRIVIPESVTYIDPMAFMASPNVTIVCKQNTAAAIFAAEHGIPVEYT
ncbi:MAG: sigma-70 family RNA polymerase sigma factor [Oscillospiraceae bacterium]|jgi:RNA polymerase sigma factor (sigma-70 family)|nr:sigma-70 family RNA polymerase sigma factor [Oscillospiraceae bacterium]